MELAVGIVIGAAFTAVVGSFVKDILMPPIGLLMGGVDFSNLYISLSGETYPSLAAAQEAGAATINYGLFLNTVISFLIVALAVFIMMKPINRLYAKPAEAPAAPTEKSCPYCQMAIPIAATKCGHCTSAL